MGTAGSGGRGRRMVPLHWLVLVLAPLAVAQPAPPNCCATKTVGGVDYTFVREDSAAMSYSCLSSCVYERDDQPGTSFCFAQGDQQVGCGDSTQGPCPEFCIEIYQPICGTNGETYSNDCYLQMAACASTIPISQAYEGECAGAMEDQTIAWVPGMTPARLCVTPGTSVAFDWTSGHNMQEVTEDSYESCTGLTNTSPESGPATWLAPNVPSVNYFACGVPGHCSNGMKAMVEVKAVCAECPAEQPEFGSACSLPEGVQCSYGEECCCGECHPNMMME